MKFFQYSANCHLNKVLKAEHPSISLILFLIFTKLINLSFASAEIKNSTISEEVKISGTLKKRHAGRNCQDIL